MDLIPIEVETREMTSLEALEYWVDGDPIEVARAINDGVETHSEVWAKRISAALTKNDLSSHAKVLYVDGKYYTPHDGILLEIRESLADIYLQDLAIALKEYDALKTAESMAELCLPVIENFERENPNDSVWNLVFGMGFVDLDANDDSETIIFYDRSCLSWEQGKWKVGSV